MLFHVAGIKIWSELFKIEFTKKNLQIFHLWAAFLIEYFTCIVEGFLWKLKSVEKDFFRKSIFSAEDVGRSIEC